MKQNVNLKKDWLTTISGVIVAILSILSMIGIFSPEQSQELGSYVIEAISAIGGIILMFAKDPGSGSSASGVAG